MKSFHVSYILSSLSSFESFIVWICVSNSYSCKCQQLTVHWPSRTSIIPIIIILFNTLKRLKHALQCAFRHKKYLVNVLKLYYSYCEINNLGMVSHKVYEWNRLFLMPINRVMSIRNQISQIYVSLFNKL